MSIPIQWNFSIDATSIGAAQVLAYEKKMPLAAASVYVNRGLDDVFKIDEFCNLSLETLHDPMSLPDVDKASIEYVKQLTKMNIFTFMEIMMWMELLLFVLWCICCAD